MTNTKQGLNSLKNQNKIPPKIPTVPNVNQPQVNETNSETKKEGVEDIITNAIKHNDGKALDKISQSALDSISILKKDILLSAALRQDSLECAEILLERGFIPQVNGVSEKIATSKGGDALKLIQKFLKTPLNPVTVAPKESTVIKETVSEPGKILVNEKSQDASVQKLAANPGVKIDSEKETTTSNNTELLKLKNQIEALNEKIKLLVEENENAEVVIKEKNAEIQTLQEVAFIGSIQNLPGEKESELEEKVRELEEVIESLKEEMENAQIEVDLLKSGRVKFQFDPVEIDGYDTLLEMAQESSFYKAIQDAIKESDLGDLKKRTNKLRPNKVILGVLFADACYSNNLSLAKAILKCGVDIDFKDNLPMIKAAKKWNRDIVLWLAKSGADWHFAGEYPLRCAARHGDTKACIELIRMGAAINARDGAVLIEALRMGHLETALALISMGVNTTNENDEFIEEIADVPELLEHATKVKEQEKIAQAIDPLILERMAGRHGVK